MAKTGVLSDTAQWWKSKDVQIRGWLDDDNGRYAFVVRVQFDQHGDEHKFVVTARNGMHTPLGVMKKLVAQADGRDAMLVVRTGDGANGPKQYVFDPKTVLVHGQDNTASDSRGDRGEQWVDFHPQWGVNLWDYVHGQQTPAAPDDDLQPLPSDDEDGDETATDGSGVTLDDYGV